MKILFWLKKHLSLALPLTMLLGLLFGLSQNNVAYLKGTILPITIFMILPMMITLNFRSLLKGKETKLILLSQGLNFLILPLIAYALGKLFLAQSEDGALGLFLMALLPTFGMTISWTQFSKGNVGAAVKLSVIGLLLGSILTPLYLKLFYASSVSMPFISVGMQIGFIIILPLISGFIIQYLVIMKTGQEIFKTKIKPSIGVFSIPGLLLMIFAATALKSKAIISDPAGLLFLLIPVSIFYISSYLLSSFIGRKFLSSENAITMVYATSLRNLSIALALAMSIFGERGSSVSLIIALAYIFQVQSAAWYSSLSQKLYKKNRLLNGTIKEEIASTR